MDRRDLWHSLALLLFALLYFSPLFLGGQVLHGRDHGEVNLPYVAWTQRVMAQGQSPFWNGAISCGDPVADAMGSTAFYAPEALVRRLFSPCDAYNLMTALDFFWAGLGCYWLLRRRAASQEAALVGALVGGFAGSMAFCLPWWTILTSFAWMPWALLGLELLLGGSLGGAALLGLSVGTQFAGGYPGLLLYEMLPFGLIFLQGWSAPRVPRGRVLALLGLAVLLAALLCAGPLLGLRRLAAASARGASLSYEAAAENSMTPAVLPQMLAPHALGRIADDSYLGVSWRFGSYDPQGLILYIGLAALALALLGLRSTPRRHAAPLLALGLLCLYALGSFTPAYAWFLKLPGLDHLRAPMKAGCFAGILLCGPVAEGFDRLRARRAAWPGWLLLWVGAALLAGALLLSLGEGALLAHGRAYISRHVVVDPIHQKGGAYYAAKLGRWAAGAFQHLLQQGLLALASGWALLRLARGGGRRWAWALLLVLGADLALNGNAGYSRVSNALYDAPPQTLAWIGAQARKDPGPWRVFTWGRNAQLLAAFPEGRRDGDLAGERLNMELPPGSASSFFGFEQFNGYTGSQLLRSQLLYAWSRDDRAGVDMGPENAELLRRRRVLQLGGARYWISAVPLKAPGLTLVRPGQPAIYRDEGALPLAYFADHSASVDGPEAALARLCDPADPSRRWSRPALVEAPGPWPTADGVLQWTRHEDQAWELDVEAGTGGSTLVLARTFYPGLFRAELDGVPVPLRAANVGFCALAVPAGRHHLRVGLDPVTERQERWHQLGLGLALLLCVIAYARSRSRHA